jgi:TolB-like protein/DNA-binding winged helix-turn-helix (wHTH) protein/Tfp pilus assembly protein PilF
MADSSSQPRLFRFGVFELDCGAGELRKQGRRVALHEQSLVVLVSLLERAGDIVTREQLQQRLWPSDTFVDFDKGLNTTISKLRDVLGDDATSPRFIETLPRRGYRFVAAVEAEISAERNTVESKPSWARHYAAWLGVALASLLAVGWVLAWKNGVSKAPTNPAPPVASIAVLPFVNVSGDPEENFIVDGVTDELINTLARAEGVHVVARTSTFKFKGKNEDIREIGRLLGSRTVLEGTVRRSPKHLRVTTQLINAADGFQVWAATYERGLEDVASIPSEIARAIVTNLHPPIGVNHKRVLTPKYTESTEAYLLYVRGLHVQRNWTQLDLAKSIDYFQRALALDPRFAPALAAMAFSHTMMHSSNSVPASEAFPVAKELALKALELQPDFSSAHSTLALIHLVFDWDWSGAEREYKRALALSPGDAAARKGYGMFLLQQRRFKESIAELTRAEKLDPLSASIVFSLGAWYLLRGDNDTALDYLRKAVDLEPGLSIAHLWQGRAYLNTNRRAAAFAAFEKASAANSGFPLVMAERAVALARVGDRSAAESLLHTLISSSDRPKPSFEIACVYAALGKHDDAFRWLEKAYGERNSNLVWVRYPECFEPLRSDPRYRSLLARMNLPQ